MRPSGARQLPRLRIGDFGPGQDHVVETYLGSKVIAILDKNDPARQILPGLMFPSDDPYTYVFVHGGREATRFENAALATHEIPDQVIAHFLLNEFGSALDGMRIRMCTCYGNMLRPGDPQTAVLGLADLLPQTSFEAYHGLVILDVNPPGLRLGRAVQWDATSSPPGPVIVGPAGNWEPVIP